VLAALKYRRGRETRFPESGNRSEPATRNRHREPIEAVDSSSQVGDVGNGSGTVREPSGTGTRVNGNQVPSLRRELVPDRLSDDDQNETAAPVEVVGEFS
jgi:hypothetical protein